MGDHNAYVDGVLVCAVYPAGSYRGLHVDHDRQPGNRTVDSIPDDWFDPGIDRNPDDPDLWVR